MYKKGDCLLLEGICKVTVEWISYPLAEVEYKDLTRRLLNLSKYEVKLLNSCKRD